MSTPIITRDELKGLIGSKGDYVLIDVREKEELENGMIPTAHNVPLSTFEDAFDISYEDFRTRYDFDRPTKEDNLVLYCRTGNRSGMATDFLIEKGYKVRNYEGSVFDWSKIDSNVKFY